MKYKNLSIAIAVASTAVSQAWANHPDDWQSAGSAVYYEDLMTNNADIKPGHCWVVDMERSESQPGWIRIQPYTRMDNYVSRILGETDMTYIYINATDPEKVYVEEFEAFPDYFEYKFRNLVPENGWEGAPCYGSVGADGVISFAPLSFAQYDESYDIWHPVSRTTGFRLEPGRDEAHDVAVRAIPSVCNNDGYIFVKADAGSDVWDIKGYVAYGEYTPEMTARAASEGFLLSSGETEQVEVSRRGLHTFVAVGLDRQGNILSADYNYAYNNVEPEDNWYDIPDEQMQEGVVWYLINTPPRPYEVHMQRHLTRPGLFRVVDPYATHPEIGYPQYLAEHSHHHYIYIDATDPARVVIEPSPVGVNMGNGDIWFTSEAGLEVLAGRTPEQAICGSVDAEGWLTFPENTLREIHKNECSAGWRYSQDFFKLHLPLKGGAVNETYAPQGEVRIYNLQGTPVGEKPVPGIYLLRGTDGSCRKIRL